MGYAGWTVFLDGEYLITGVTVTDEKSGSFTLAGLYVEAGDDMDSWSLCGLGADSGTAGDAMVVECEGAGVYGTQIYLSSAYDFNLCEVSVQGYPVVETVTAPLEAELEAARLTHGDAGLHYDTVQEQYNTLSDYYDQVQERFVELSNYYNEVSMWKSEVDGEATLLQAVVEKYEARTVGENCVFGLAGFAWWCKEAAPIAY